MTHTHIPSYALVRPHPDPDPDALGRAPRVGDAFGGGVVRTVEALFPHGHYRITIDVEIGGES